MSKHVDGRISLGSDKVHLESVHPDLVMPIKGIVNGTPVPVTSINVDPNEIVSSMGIVVAASLGLVNGYSVVSKFGRNPSIDLGDTEDIWTVGGTKVWLSTAVTMEAISTSGDDAAAPAIGAQIITIQGLDENFDDAEEDIIMNGASASAATTTTFIRISRAFVKQVGTYLGSNIGLITIRISGAGATQTDIVAGVGQTDQTHFL